MKYVLSTQHDIGPGATMMSKAESLLPTGMLSRGRDGNKYLNNFINRIWHNGKSCNGMENGQGCWGREVKRGPLS